MFLTELDVVNDCLSTLGELSVNELDDEHVLIAAARRAFRQINLREQSKQWWFNTELIKLTVDEDSHIFTPADSIRCTPVCRDQHYIQRGRRLYDPANSTYKIARPYVECILVRAVEFEDLPPTAQIVVNVATQLKFMAAYDADRTKYGQLVAEYQEAYANMNAEHIRNMRTNLIERHSTLGRLIPIRGSMSRRLPLPR
jgi:hypothetical protein